MKRELSETARKVLKDVEDTLREGFTGKIEMHATEGGISNVDYTVRKRPKDLPGPEERD